MRAEVRNDRSPDSAGRGNIVVVTGLPRSGTSMMMQMLAAGGLPLMTDGRRGPDEDNPKGYFEFERVKDLASDASWIDEARGMAVKIVSPLLPHLPTQPGRHYAVIRMDRAIDAVLASQRAMLARAGHAVEPSDDLKLKELFFRHLDEIDRLLAGRADVSSLTLRYEDVVASPQRTADSVAEFLGGGLDRTGMAKSVERALRRSG
jgi:hypothetical protein